MSEGADPNASSSTVQTLMILNLVMTTIATVLTGLRFKSKCCCGEVDIRPKDARASPPAIGAVAERSAVEAEPHAPKKRATAAPSSSTASRRDGEVELDEADANDEEEEDDVHRQQQQQPRRSSAASAKAARASRKADRCKGERPSDGGRDEEEEVGRAERGRVGREEDAGASPLTGDSAALTETPSDAPGTASAVASATSTTATVSPTDVRDVGNEKARGAGEETETAEDEEPVKPTRGQRRGGGGSGDGTTSAKKRPKRRHKSTGDDA